MNEMEKMKKDVHDHIVDFDKSVLKWAKKHSSALARFAMFIIFFWFGFLKLVGLSEAEPLVLNLLEQMVPTWDHTGIFIVLGVLEVLIGLMFLIKPFLRLVIFFMFLHMAMTFLPLIFLPEASWNGFLMPTLVGQYILKNVAIVALALVVLSKENTYLK